MWICICRIFTLDRYLTRSLPVYCKFWFEFMRLTYFGLNWLLTIDECPLILTCAIIFHSFCKIIKSLNFFLTHLFNIFFSLLLHNITGIIGLWRSYTINKIKIKKSVSTLLLFKRLLNSYYVFKVFGSCNNWQSNW